MEKKHSFRSSASFGKRQEYSVVARLLQEGLDVYMTLVDDQGIDCIIRKNSKKYYDIQIKARSKDCSPKNAGRFVPLTIEPRQNYYFIFYSEQVDKTWVMPSEDLVNKKLAGRNKTGSNAGKYHILFTGVKQGKVYPLDKFKRYEDAFHLLK